MILTSTPMPRPQAMPPTTNPGRPPASAPSAPTLSGDVAAGELVAAAGSARDARLRSRRDFVRVQSLGRKWRGRHMVVAVTPPAVPGAASEVHPSPFRVGYTVSRKVGGAVIRNRVKRRLRAAWRQVGRFIAMPGDFVVIAFPGAAAVSQKQLAQELACLLTKAMRQASSGVR